LISVDYEVELMTARIATISAALFFSLTLIAGTAVAGGGSCGGKKGEGEKEGGAAAVVMPSAPLA
jgi:hypothetical protein